MVIAKIISDLRGKGERITGTREQILNILLSAKEPISANNILKKLSGTNKTTVYRFLDKLVEHQVVEEVNLGGKATKYEIKRDHHHHLVCKKCSEVNKIVSKDLEKKMNDLESEMQKQHNFKQIEHVLEFYGYCVKCS